MSASSAWPTRRLGDLVKLTSGQSPTGFKFDGKGTPYFKVDQLGKSTKYLAAGNTPYRGSRVPTVPARSVLIAKRGGAIALNRVRILAVPGFMDTNVMALTPTSELNSEFLFYWLSHRGLWDIADVTSVPQINNKHINPLEIALPKPPEQRAIVSALQDCDDAIATLERIITKKQAIKHGLMQQLLTGRTRLPGFDGDWGPLSVAARSVMKARIGWQGLKTDEYRDSGTYRLVGGTEFADGRIDWSRTPFVDEWRYDQDAYIQLRQGDVLLTKDGTIGKTAFVDEVPGPATLNSGVFVIRPVRGAYEPAFLFFMLRSRVFEEFLGRLSAGSTISHLYQRDLVTLVLDVPPTIEEQRAIASVLSDAEEEISALQDRLSKARAIKTGTMQQLLTGRVRLPLEATA